MSSSGSSTSRAPPPPPPGGNNLGVAEEDRIEVAHVRPQPPPPPPPAMAAMLPYHHRSRNNDDPDFQTTTLTRPVAEGPAGANSSSRTGSVPAIDLHHHAGHLVHHPAHVRPPHHELRRPDSVITTSSMVSSSDGASQAGDSSTEVGLHSVYAFSGLYGNKLAQVKNQTPSDAGASSLTSTSTDAATAPSNTANDAHAHLITAASAAKQLPMAAPGEPLKPTHRRQASHPGHFTESNVPANIRGQAQQQPLQQQQQPATDAIGRIGLSRTASGHRRSNSYGQQHHRALTATTSCGAGAQYSTSAASGAVPGSHHRRTASSVIETLQTLTCSATGGTADGTVDKRDEHIAAFLENLKKEQQEKFEKQELHEMQDELEDLRDCGIGGCKPKILKPLANIKVFVFLLSMLVTLQQALSSGYLNSVITTIEKRYEIPSSISGIVASMYEIGNVGTVIFVSYLGSRRHIPTWIAMGVLVMGIGSITFSLPHFLGGEYMLQDGSSASGGSSSSDNICRGAPKITHQSSANDLLDLVKKVPGLDKIKSLTEELSPPQLGPTNNNYNREDNCISKPNKSSAMPIFIFMIAQLLLGCGGSPLFTLGTTYVDNHVKRDDSSMYIGIMYSMCAFGPVCGFLLGAFLLSNHVDTFTIDTAQMLIDSSDRHWVGMWWGGFLICGVALILISIPFFFFPKELKKEKVKVYIDDKYHHATEPSIRPKPKIGGPGQPGGAANPADVPDHPSSSRTTTLSANARQMTSASKAASTNNLNNNYGKDIKDIPRSTWNLLTNKIYMVTCMGACMELIIVSGFIVFLPKYLETQFNLGKSEASMFTGGIAIPGACIGIFLGGYLLKKFQLRPLGAVQLVLFFNVICLACYALLFVFGCDNVKMAGATMPYFNSANKQSPAAGLFKINLTSSCNFGCECDMNDVQPVCGANGLTYFSPCHAGCTTGGDNFTNCACVLGGKAHSDPFSGANPLHGASSALSKNAAESHENEFQEVTMIPVASSGTCNSQCQMIMPFMVLLFFMTLVVAVTQMPVLMVVLRSVEEEEKAFALGIQFVIFRLFGYIPSPIIFGSVIDSTCLVWKSTCEGAVGGRCLLYDIVMFRYKYIGVCCGIKVLSVVIFIIDWWLIRKRQNAEKKQSALTVGEVVNSIISLDKLFEPDGALWVKMSDPEEAAAAGKSANNGAAAEAASLREVSEDDSSAGAVTVTAAAAATEPRLEPPSPSKPATEVSACLERKAAA